MKLIDVKLFVSMIYVISQEPEPVFLPCWPVFFLEYSALIVSAQCPWRTLNLDLEFQS